LNEEMKILKEKKKVIKANLVDIRDKITASRRTTDVDPQSIIALRNEAVAKRVEFRTLKVQIKHSKIRISKLHSLAEPEPKTERGCPKTESV